MVKTVVESLVQGLGQAFNELKVERGEIGWYHQRKAGESFARLDAAVRSALLEAVETPDAFDKLTFFKDEHYVSRNARDRASKPA